MSSDRNRYGDNVVVCMLRLSVPRGSMLHGECDVAFGRVVSNYLARLSELHFDCDTGPPAVPLHQQQFPTSVIGRRYPPPQHLPSQS